MVAVVAVCDEVTHIVLYLFTWLAVGLASF